MKRFRLHAPLWWRPLWPAALIVAASALVLTHSLASLAPRLSPTEQVSVSSASHLTALLQASAPIPLRLLEWAALALHVPNTDLLLRMRFPSVVLGLASLSILAYIMQRWYGQRSMIFGLALIACSAWFLHISRFAGLEVEYFAGIVALLAVHLALYDHEANKLVWFVWLSTNVVLLFVPGLIWFVIISAAWQWRAIFAASRVLTIWQLVLSGLIPLLGLGWLTYDTLRQPSLLLPALGLPSDLHVLHQLPQSMLSTLKLFVYTGPNRPELWLGRLPLLDMFVIAMFVAGAIFYIRHWRAARTQLLAGYMLLSIILISLGGIGISTIIPLIYLVSIAGMAYILYFWLRVFPRNPLARYTGIAAIALLLATSCYYNLVQYFIAWPHNTDSAKVYQLHG